MTNDILIVIDEEILPELHRYDKPYGLIPFWLNHKNTRAGVSTLVYQNFSQKKGEELKNLSEESKECYFGIIEGLITECEDDDEKDPIKATMNIINRHYATIKYLLVKDVSKYREKGLKINDDCIMNQKEFYSKMEVEERGLISNYLKRKIFQDN